jgi:hypothetical protein
VPSASFRMVWRRAAFRRRSIGSLSDWMNTPRHTATCKRRRGSVRSGFSLGGLKSNVNSGGAARFGGRLGHLNLLGEYDFSEDKLQDSVGIKPPKLTD